MQQTIFIVYVTYGITVENLFAFNLQSDAEEKRLELLKQWVNEDQFNSYIAKNKIDEVTLETYDDYFLEVEDDSYVGIDSAILN